MTEAKTEMPEEEKLEEFLMQLPEFKRLNGVKQLGCLHLIFGEKIKHNRLLYSVKLFLKARSMAQQLKDKQPELNITDQDVMCVAFAGLCYNLGQPPLSYDYWRISKKNGGFFDEDVLLRESCKLLDKVWPVITKMDVLNPRKVKLDAEDKAFVKALMRGKEKDQKECDGYPLRCVDKDFLYEIVNNKYNRLDVKLLTYLTEDAPLRLGIKNWSATSDEIDNMVKTAQVMFIDEYGTTRSHITYSDKFRQLMVQLFEKKMYLHRTMYQNPEHRLNVIKLSDAYEREHVKVAKHKFSTLTDDELLELLKPSMEENNLRKYKLAAKASVLVKRENLSQLKKKLAKIKPKNDTIKVDVVDYSDSYTPGQLWIYSDQDQVQAYSMASLYNAKTTKSESREEEKLVLKETRKSKNQEEEKIQLLLPKFEYHPYTECSIRWYENTETLPRNPSDGETFKRHQQFLEKECKSFSHKQFFLDAINSKKLVMGAGCGVISGLFLLPEMRRLTCQIVVNALDKDKRKNCMKVITTSLGKSMAMEKGIWSSFIRWLQKMMSTEPGTLTPLMRTQGNGFQWLQIIAWFTLVGFASSLVDTYLKKHKKDFYKYGITSARADYVSWGAMGGGFALAYIMNDSKTTFKAHVVDALPRPRRWMLYGYARGSPLKAIAIGLFSVLVQPIMQQFSEKSNSDSYG